MISDDPVIPKMWIISFLDALRQMLKKAAVIPLHSGIGSRTQKRSRGVRTAGNTFLHNYSAIHVFIIHIEDLDRLGITQFFSIGSQPHRS